MMLLAALCTCMGQLMWKLAAGCIWFLVPGFVLYGGGALLMILAMRYGELSVLHPMLGAGYALSVVLGLLVFREAVTVRKVLGIGVIVLGLAMLARPERGERR